MFGDCPAEKNEDLLCAFSADIIKGLIYLTSFSLNKDSFSLQPNQALFSAGNLPAITKETARGLINIWRSFTAKDFRPFVKQIDIPVLLLYGEKSQFYLRQTGQWMKDNIAGSRLKIFPDGDHYPFIAQNDEFFQSVIEFILE